MCNAYSDFAAYLEMSDKDYFDKESKRKHFHQAILSCKS